MQALFVIWYFVINPKIIYANEKENQCLSKAMNEAHIIDQWIFMKTNATLFHQNDQKLAFRFIERVASGPNAQTGCERANSEYDHFKNSLSNRMQLPMIKSRLRIKINGPPTSMFQPKDTRKVCLHKGH